MARADGDRYLVRCGMVRAIVLLEVVISLGVLAVGMTLIGAQLRGGFEAARLSQERLGAMMLAESILAEIDMGVLELDDESAGDFGLEHPGYAWQVGVESSAIEGLSVVTVSIWSGPIGEEGEPSLEDYTQLYACRTLRADPTAVDLAEVVGEERADQIEMELPAELTDYLSGLGIDLDLRELDVSAIIRQLDMATLLEMLPLLQRQFQGQLSGSLWDRIRQEIANFQKSGEVPELPGEQPGDEAEGLEEEPETDWQGEGPAVTPVPVHERRPGGRTGTPRRRGGGTER